MPKDSRSLFYYCMKLMEVSKIKMNSQEDRSGNGIGRIYSEQIEIDLEGISLLQMDLI